MDFDYGFGFGFGFGFDWRLGFVLDFLVRFYTRNSC